MRDHFQSEQQIHCPYCGEALIVLIDPSVPQQEYIEDCQVCCRPMVLQIDCSDPEWIMVEARSEDD